MDSGETMLTSYFAVLTRSDTGAVRVKDLGNTARIDREVVPFRWFVSNQNNILAEVLDVTKFRNRFNRAVADADEPLARLFDNKWENIEPSFKKLLDNHRNNLPGESGLGPDAVEKKDVLNALIGIATKENRTRNPYSGRYGKDSAIEKFRLDRINDSTKSGRTGYQFDYQKAAGNALPDKPAPLPDLSRDLPTPKGQAMPDNMASGEQWDAYAENLRDDVESWSPARDTGRIDYEMMDVVDNFVDFARNNPQLSGEELSKQFYRAEKPTATQRKKLNAALENVGQPPKSIATPQGQAMP
jgi:hypothetical protein